MTNEQFEIICTALAEKIQSQEQKIQSQETTILLKDYEISDLKKKIAELEEMKAKGRLGKIF